jgi:hypothetical protein
VAVEVPRRDQAGGLNQITAGKVGAAARLVRTGSWPRRTFGSKGPHATT